MSETTESIITALRRELGNIGIAIVSTRVGEGETTLNVHGTGNRRRASYSVPNGEVSEQDAVDLIADAMQDIRQQVASGSGTWDEA